MVRNDQITLLLGELADGDRSALDRLIPIFYKELRKIANGFVRQESPGHTLQPTALVHELSARIVGQQHPEYRNREHFLGVAAKVMRQILIDHARMRHAAKRGGVQGRFSLDESIDVGALRPPQLIAVDDALRELERRDPRKAQLVEMRFFGGLTAEESAVYQHVPVTTVRRDLRTAQAWLQRELDQRSLAAQQNVAP